MRYLLINSDNIVENAIEADSDYEAPEGFTLMQSDIGGPGDTWPLPVPPAVNPNVAILGQIYILEQSITPRRIREAILGTDGGWLATQNTAITALRAQLTK